MVQIGKAGDASPVGLEALFENLRSSCTPLASSDHVLYGQIFHGPQDLAPPLGPPQKPYGSYGGADIQEDPQLSEQNGNFSKTRTELDRKDEQDKARYLFLYRESDCLSSRHI